MKHRFWPIVLMAFSTAQASNWVKVPHGETATGADFMDTDTIKIIGDVRRVWIKTVFVPKTMKGLPPKQNTWIALVMSLAEYNCTDETQLTLSFTAYYIDSDSTAVNSPSAWTPVIPETVENARLVFVCHLKH